nr:40S ribosomal protein S5 isoform X1 [Vicugna pacos]XP_031531963.1 40S ribosomal protein S5 isoform X1 [Vicugna pacos]
MTEWETAAPAVAETPDIKLFGKWSTDDVQINDISLQDYIAVKEKYAKYLPHSAGRYAAKRFRKAQCPIVERLTNSMMMHGRNNGKKLMTVRIVKHAFEIIHLLTGENPLQVLVNAIINSGPREDSTRIGRAGTVRRQAVDVSPLRRVNQAIWLLCTGAREAAFRNIKTIAECLADELINAAKGSSKRSEETPHERRYTAGRSDENTLNVICHQGITSLNNNITTYLSEWLKSKILRTGGNRTLIHCC